MDYIPDTLSKVVRYYKKAKQAFPNVLLKVYSYQMFRALGYMEGNGFEFEIRHGDLSQRHKTLEHSN